MAKKRGVLPKSRPIHDPNEQALAVHHYRVFGLAVRSDIELPELFADDERTPPDVTITLERIDTEIDQDGLQAEEGALVLVVPQIARFRIIDGTRIVVDPKSGVPARNIRLFLLGSAFGALLHQRGLLPLHANAIEIDGMAVAFMGPSGTGKSTLATWFHDRGFKVISDDVCVVDFGLEGRPQAAPGLPRLRLWTDALELTGRDHLGLARSYLDDEDEKFDVPVEAASAARSEVQLAAIYLLDCGEEFCIASLHGLEAADAIFANTYRGEYLAQTGGQKEHWDSAIRLVRETPVFRAMRKWDTTLLDEQCLLLLDHARALLKTLGAGSGEVCRQR